MLRWQPWLSLGLRPMSTFVLLLILCCVLVIIMYYFNNQGGKRVNSETSQLVRLTKRSNAELDLGLVSIVFASKIRKFLPIRKVAELNICGGFFPPKLSLVPGLGLGLTIWGFLKMDNGHCLHKDVTQSSAADACGMQTVGLSVDCSPLLFSLAWVVFKEN